MIDLGPNYGNSLVKDACGRKKNLTEILRVRMRPQACVRILNSYVHTHKPTYATRVPDFSIRQVFYENHSRSNPKSLGIASNPSF